MVARREFRRASRLAGGGSPDAVVPGTALTGLQAESWRLLREEHSADVDARAAFAVWERARALALPEARALVERFLAGDIGLEAFRAALDRHAKSDWRALALRGSAGAMLLNQAAKHASDAAALERVLRAALVTPPDAMAAESRLRAFVESLGTLVPDVAPTRAVSFAASCWHVQAPERWPAYQPSARRALAAEEALFVPTGDASADYVAFRDAFLALAAALGASGAELEHLCRWRNAQHDAPHDDEAPDTLDMFDTARRAPRRRVSRTAPARTPPARTPPVRVLRVRESAPVYATTDVVTHAAPGHTQVQWQLARLGHALGCRVWIAANDHARAWEGEPLGRLSLPRLPRLGLDDESERLVRLIDVVWLTGRHRVAAAFEVERTTSVHSGLLRMADLAALAPNLSFPMYVVVPRERLSKVRRELARPSLQALGLHRRCGFFAAETLLESADAIAQWGGPDAIARLAEHVVPND